MKHKSAIVLLSGGLDSATALYTAKSKGYRCFCLFFDYGQRHRRELKAARKIAKECGCAFQVLKISLPWGGSSLVDRRVRLPLRNNEITRKRDNGIPNTYVPGRNIIFLSFALSYAESIGASAIFIGAHAQDYSGYPDCRPEFFRAFAQSARHGMRSGVEKNSIEIKTPLIHKTKAQIIRLGNRLHVPFELTWSCYKGDLVPCEECDSCTFRAKGFKEAGLRDPLIRK